MKERATSAALELPRSIRTFSSAWRSAGFSAILITAVSFSAFGFRGRPVFMFWKLLHAWRVGNLFFTLFFLHGCKAYRILGL